MNFYRGCKHNCVYCDGRSEGYYVEGEFGEDVWVKVNAIELLRKELDPRRKRTPLKPCFIMLGGGVGDSYQPIEEKYKLSRKALQLLHNFNLPVSILTKSTLIERDIDIIKKINERKRAIVSFSFSSVDEKISSIFEPGVPPPRKRLETLHLFKNEGIACGMFLMPVIPFITDTPTVMERTIRKAKEIDLDFIIFAGMTLKDGRQKNYFLDTLKENYPHLIPEYSNIYKKDIWGGPVSNYQESIHKTFNSISKKYKIPRRIPAHLFDDILSENDLVRVILEHLEYLLKLEGKESSYRWAANSIAKLTEPLSNMKKDLRRINGVGPTTERIILEILETGTSSYYEKLLTG
ncbi:MAG: radical SAM protein [Thermoplasmatales archaeon]|nr:radical SAM protein [Thermoplasmatales archaeon]